jgi:hypothetical protein
VTARVPISGGQIFRLELVDSTGEGGIAGKFDGTMELANSDLEVLRSNLIEFEGQTDLGPVKLTPAKLEILD